MIFGCCVSLQNFYELGCYLLKEIVSVLNSYPKTQTLYYVGSVQSGQCIITAFLRFPLALLTCFLHAKSSIL